MPGGLPKKENPVTLEVSRERGSVYVERSFTKNMENFNSAKVTVGITLPIDPTPTELKEAMATVKIVNEKCEKFLDEELDKLLL